VKPQEIQRGGNKLDGVAEWLALMLCECKFLCTNSAWILDTTKNFCGFPQPLLANPGHHHFHILPNSSFKITFLSNAM